CLSVAASVPLPGDQRCDVVGTENIPLVQPPTAVRVWFSESVEPYGEGLWVIGPDGGRSDRGPVRVSPFAESIDVDATQTGTYLVHWQIVAADTHPARGSFTFVVRQPGGVLASVGNSDLRAEASAVAPIGLALGVVARWLHFLGYALGFGVLAFWLFIIPFAAKSRPLVEEAASRIWLLVNVGIVLLVVAEPIALLGQTASLGPGAIFNPDIVSAALDSSFGRALGVRLGAPFLLWLLVGVARNGSRRSLVIAMGLALALGFFDGTTAHARGVEPVWLSLIVNAAHVSALGFWLGGLAGLVAVWPFLQGVADAGVRNSIADRFGRGAIVSVLVLIATGAVMAALHLRGPADLLDTSYGVVLAAKIAFVVAFLLFVGLMRAARAGPRLWVAECVVIAGVLILAGLL
ncbi:MAG TPA: copper resistance protein CopC, partial [Chloroflexota bacterium]|nr:copper resistance protein CopC [Chloroflexota bacterium]